MNNDTFFFIVVLSHGKLDLVFFFMAGPKSAKLQHTSEAEIAEENNYRVLEKYVRLVAVTCTSPKVGVAASKLIPRKEKWGARGLKGYPKQFITLISFLVSTVSIRKNFLSIFWLRGRKLCLVGKFNQMKNLKTYRTDY